MKTWNIGNTTVRNPERLRSGLQVFADHFVGRKWDADAEERFYRALVEADVYVPGERPVKPTSTGQTGRKWASAFKQLGFARVGRRAGLVELTAVGEALLRDETSTNDIFLRQLLKYHLPSPIEPRTRNDGFDVYPFRLTLRILNDLRLAGSPGLTKEELGLYIVTTMLDSGEADAVARITSYRAERDAATGKVAKKRLHNLRRLEVASALYADETQQAKLELLNVLIDRAEAEPEYLDSSEADDYLSKIVRTGKGFQTARAQSLKRRLRDAIRDCRPRENVWEMASEQYLGTRARSLADYADTASRYFAMSGLFSFAGSRLVFKESLLPLIDSLVAEAYPHYDESAFLEAFYDPNLPALPTDDTDVLEAMVATLLGKQAELAAALGKPAPPKAAPTAAKPAELKREMESLRQEVSNLRELQFYRQQSQQSQDIADFFDEIKSGSLFGGDAYLPAFYEWNIWRVFLAINELRNEIPETRGFKVDEEMYPIHHAASGRADMLFEYDHCMLVVEASLSTGENQWSQEQEPVQRHVKDVMLRCPDKRVCGIFVAPRIDPNTAVNFRRACAWMNGREVPLDIVPLTTDQLTRILEWQTSEQYDTAKLLALVRDLAAARNDVGDGVQWLVAISHAIDTRAAVTNAATTPPNITA